LQAVYQPENIGHFGLGFAAYTHFTSPIRRYPDLLVHRALRFLIRSKAQAVNVRKVTGVEPISRKEIYPYDLKDMQSFGETCSMSERRADAASYDVIDWLKCEYIKDRVGDEFPGTVSSVTGFGLFVELRDIYVEGLVHITALKNDYYQFDPVRHLLRGERSGVSYHLGDPVRVKVVRVDLDDRKIDLVMMDGSGDKPEGGSSQPGGREHKPSAGKDKGKGREQRADKSSDAGKGGGTGKAGKGGKAGKKVAPATVKPGEAAAPKKKRSRKSGAAGGKNKGKRRAAVPGVDAGGASQS